METDKVAGAWNWANGRLNSADWRARIEFPFVAPAEYDLRSVFSLKGEACPFFLLARNDARFSIGVGWSGFTGVENIDELSLGSQPKKIVLKLTPGVSYTAVCQVRKDTIRLFIDGRLLFALDCANSQLSRNKDWNLNDNRLIGLGSTRAGSVAFESCQLLEVTGKGTFTRPDAAKNQPAAKPEPPGAVVYLSDLPEQEVKVLTYQGRTMWAKNGGSGDLAVVVNKVPSPKGLFMHPTNQTPSHVAYMLEGKYQTFEASAAINDSAKNWGGNAALTFTVVGDGKLLWASQPIKVSSNAQNCRVDVGGIQKFELVVECPGDSANAHAVWVEPRLTPVGAPVPPKDVLVAEDFEKLDLKKLPAGWTLHETKNPGDYSIVAVPGRGKVLKISNKGGAHAYAQLEITLDPVQVRGHMVRISVWAKFPGSYTPWPDPAALWARPRISLIFNNKEGKEHYACNCNLEPNKPDWQMYEGHGKLDKDVQSVRLVLGIPLVAAEAFFDDLIVELDPDLNSRPPSLRTEAAPVPPKDVLVAEDFEHLDLKKLPAGWKLNDTKNPGDYSIVAEPGHGKVLKIRDKGDASAWLLIPLDLAQVRDHTVRISVWAKCPNSYTPDPKTTWARPKINLIVKDKDGQDQYRCGNEIAPDKPDWQMYEGHAKIDMDAQSVVVVLAIQHVAAEVFFDDLVVELDPDPNSKPPSLRTETGTRPAESDENPFKRAKVGDWVEYTMQTKLGDKTSGGFSTIRQSVTKKSDTAATVEMLMKAEATEMKSQYSVDLTRKAYPSPMPGCVAPGPNTKELDSGTEVLTVAGKSLNTTWVLRESEAAGATIKSKQWTASDVPVGGIVKAENTMGEIAFAFELKAFGFGDGKAPALQTIASAWISKDATYTVSSRYKDIAPSPQLLNGQGGGFQLENLKYEFAFHTKDDDPNPHIVIDLVRICTIDALEIVNRTNLKPETTKPDREKMLGRARTLTAWTSSSASGPWTEVWRATDVQEEWQVRLTAPVTARYVKLGLRETTALHLFSVKIFGVESAVRAPARPGLSRP